MAKISSKKSTIKYPSLSPLPQRSGRGQSSSPPHLNSQITGRRAHKSFLRSKLETYPIIFSPPAHQRLTFGLDPCWGGTGTKKSFMCTFPESIVSCRCKQRGVCGRNNCYACTQLRGGLFDQNQLFKVFQAFSDVHLC